jgi:hypothetical protein
MAVINPEGLFNGDRLRRCSNAAQLHWPRLYLASNGFARLEINYARIIGRAYPTFNPTPSETELQSWIQEYVQNHLLFLFEADGRLWGQWDTRREFLPKYKTAADRRSPAAPEPEFTDWKKSYPPQTTGFVKCFGNISETFQHGVGIGIGKTNTCAANAARVGELPSADTPGSDSEAVVPRKPVRTTKQPSGELVSQQERWFEEWWAEYWPPRRDRKKARTAFLRCVKTEDRFRLVMAATRAQKPEMLQREASKRPYGTTWLNGERWDDEQESPAPAPPTNRVGYGKMTAWKEGIGK